MKHDMELGICADKTWNLQMKSTTASLVEEKTNVKIQGLAEEQLKIRCPSAMTFLVIGKLPWWIPWLHFIIVIVSRTRPSRPNTRKKDDVSGQHQYYSPSTGLFSAMQVAQSNEISPPMTIRLGVCF
jgi:hypothetical protein